MGSGQDLMSSKTECPRCGTLADKNYVSLSVERMCNGCGHQKSLLKVRSPIRNNDLGNLLGGIAIAVIGIFALGAFFEALKEPEHEEGRDELVF